MHASDASRRNYRRRNPDKVVRAITQTIAVISIGLVGLIVLSLTHSQVQADAEPPVQITHVVSR
jgi:hypothetical protein